jgi:nicotinamide-nucleotide amidase
VADDLEALAARAIAVCRDSQIRLVIAESLTGGLLASTLIAIPGASQVVLAAVVAYHDAAKHQLLSVPTMTLTTFGAVSAQTAEAMARGARLILKNVPDIDAARVVGISTTGVAGPDLQEGKQVGTVHLGVATDDEVRSLDLHFYGDRGQIRQQACVAALNLLLEQLAE